VEIPRQVFSAYFATPRESKSDILQPEIEHNLNEDKQQGGTEALAMTDPGRRHGMVDQRQLYTRTFFTLACANFCVLSSLGAFFMFPLFVLEKGGTEADIGVIMGAFSLASVVCRPWISRLIDRTGRKRTYTFGLLIMTVAPLMYLAFRGHLDEFYPAVVMVRILHGVGFAFCITAAFTTVADIIPKSRLNEGLGIFGVSGLTGSALGPAMAELIIRRLGFDVLFIAAGAVSFVGFLFHLPVRESYSGSSKREDPAFFQILRSSRVTTVAILAVLFGFGLAASNGFVSPFASEKNLELISLYYIAYSLAAVLTRLFGARLADRFGEDRVIPYALTLTGMGLLSLMLVSGSLLLMASGFMAGVGHGFLYPSLNALALRGESVAVRGRITGIFTGSIDAGVFGGSVVLGYVGKWAGFTTLFATAGSALIVALWIFLFQRARLAKTVSGSGAS